MATLTKEVGETRSQVASLTQEAIETKRWKERFEKHLALGRITLDPVMESCLSYSYLLKLKWELEYGSTVPGGIGAPAFWESEVNRMKDLEGMKGSWAEAYKRVRDNMREFDKDPGRPTSFGTDIAEQRRKFEAEREPAAYTHYEFQRIKAPDVERKFGKESRQIYQQLVEKVSTNRANRNRRSHGVTLEEARRWIEVLRDDSGGLAGQKWEYASFWGSVYERIAGQKATQALEPDQQSVRLCDNSKKY